ncbi:PBAN-type neuropeptides-like [Trichoplusia ni]|uniref:PBAN-type neuropeptides n=1 Tax=Trichoplusia ni TaxID=7111 RepID=A0A7E5X2X2_TRINI|nr:PBAN-type neuropeptides-like [Trichoplusia ni]
MFTSLQIFGITLVLVIACVLCSNDVKDAGRGAHSDRGGLWFGPRLGKRSLASENKKQAFLKVLEAADALRYYDEQYPRELQGVDPETSVTKKVIFTPKLGRNIIDEEEVEREDFTPRLGRQVVDEMPATPTDQQLYGVDQNTIESRAKYFSPRLGRSMNFSPRLGRELAYEMLPRKIRLVRSINKTHST